MDRKRSKECGRYLLAGGLESDFAEKDVPTTLPSTVATSDSRGCAVTSTNKSPIS
jgi:hypothetical protein